jgi:F0F1-type ATP synthase membrane subunit b/b'
MKLEFDYTLLVQFAQLLILLIFLHFLVFKPFLRALGKRQEAIKSLTDQAEGSAQGVESLGKAYEEKLKEKKAPILAEREKNLKESHSFSMTVIEEARRDLADELAKVKDTVRKEVEQTMERLKGQTEAFAGEIVQKIMKRGA